jgi:hypothetical protein
LNPPGKERVTSDFRLKRDQRELFGLVASVPTARRPQNLPLTRLGRRPGSGLADRADWTTRPQPELGHSTGGLAAVRFTLMNPDRVTHLVPEDPLGLADCRTGIPPQSGVVPGFPGGS